MKKKEEERLRGQLKKVEQELGWIKREKEKWKWNYEELKRMKGEGLKKGQSTLADFELLRKMQEQLFEIVNMLRQEIEEDDAQAPARLVFKRNALA